MTDILDAVKSGDWRRVPPRIWACVAIGAAWLVFFHAAIFSTKVFYARDLLMTEIPLRYYLRERLAAGQLPQWYPYEMFGTPFAGIVIASFFHPRTLLFLLFSASASTKWSLLLAYLFGLIGAYRLARGFGTSRVASVSGAFVFALSGLAISYGNKTNMLMGLVAVPWMLAAVWQLTRRDNLRDVVSLGVWWALIFLGGDPQIFIESAIVGVALLFAGGLRWTSLIRFAMGGVLAVLLSGAEMVPSLAFGEDSIRSFWKETRTLARMWALHPLRLAEFFIPNFIPDAARADMGQVLETRETFFVEWVFVGGAAIALAVIGAIRQRASRVVWITTALLGVWLATGWYGGFIEYWWKIVPYLAKFRYPEKYVGIVMVAMAPLVAFGVDAIGSLSPRARRVPLAIGAGLFGLGILIPADGMAHWALNLTGVTQLDDTLFRTLSNAWASGLLRTATFLLVFGGVLWWLQTERLALLAIPGIVFLEMWSANGNHLPLVDEKIAESIGPMGRALAAQRGPNEPPPRVYPAGIDWERKRYAPDTEVRMSHLSLDADDSGRGHVNPIEINEPGEEWRVLRTFFGKSGVDPNIWYGRFNTCYRVATSDAPPRPEEVPITRVFDDGLVLLKEPCLPRAFLARAEPVPDQPAAKARMKEGIPEDLVVWEGGPKIESAGGAVQWAHWEPEYLKLEVDASTQSALVETDSITSGWSATLDGKHVDIYPTDAAARGVVVPAGKHTVEMRYHAPGRGLGLCFSVFGLFACFALVRRSRTQAPVIRYAGLPGAEPAGTPAPDLIPIRETVAGFVRWLHTLPPSLRSAIALGAVWIIFFGMPPIPFLMGTTTQSAGSLIFSSKVLFDRDLMLTEMPLRDYMGERLRSGHLPQWYPYEIMGIPFAGGLVANPFHPLVLLHLFFSSAVAVKWRILLAYLLGLIGAYRLARRFEASRPAAIAGACAFAFSGYIISVNNDMPFLTPLVTAPWMVAAALRLTERQVWRDVVALGVWWALVFYGGDAQLFLECGLVTVALLLAIERPWEGLDKAWNEGGISGVLAALRPRAITRFSLGAVLAGLLSAAELLPAFSLRHQFERETWKETTQLGRTWAVSKFRFPDYLFPRFVPDAWREQMGAIQNPRLDYFAFSLFLGATAVFLCVPGLLRKTKTRTILGVMLALSFWLAMGWYGGFLEIWWKVAPFFSKFRYPEKYVAVMILILCPLVAAGVDAVRSGSRRAGIVAIVLGGGLLAAGLLVPSASLQNWWVHAFPKEWDPNKPVDPAMAIALGENWTHGLRHTGVLLLVLGFVLQALERERRWFIALPALVFVDLWLGNSGRMPRVSKEVAADVGPLTRALAAQQPPNEPPVRVYSGKANIAIDRMDPDDRITRIHDLVYANDAGRLHVAPFDINAPTEEWRVMKTFFGKTASVVGNWYGQFNICYRVVTDGATVGEAAMEPGEEIIPNASEGGYTLVKHHCLPRAFLASAESVPEGDYQAAQARMKTGLADDHVVWEGGPVIEHGEGTVTWRKAEPEYLEMEVDAKTPSALVVTEAFAAGWDATIDDAPTPIYATSVAIRGIVVPQGRHVVRMTYHAPGLNLGLFLSAIGLACCGGLLWLERRERASALGLAPAGAAPAS
jgi:hypothetical protein